MKKRKYVPTYEQFYSGSRDENFIDTVKQGAQKVGQRIGQAVQKGIDWFKDIFSHPMMKIQQVMGGRAAIYTGPGSVQDPNRAPTVGVYDFFTGKTDARNESRERRNDQIIPNDRVSLLDEKVDYTKYDNIKQTLSVMNQYRSFLEAIIPLESPDPEVPNKNNDEMLEIISDAHEYQENPPFILGAPGIGKTQLMIQAAEKKGIGLVIFNTAIKDPTDFIGLPSVSATTYKKGKLAEMDPDREQDNTPMTEFALPKVWPRSNRPDGKPLDGTEQEKDLVGGIIFFDELNVANQAVLNAGLQLLGSRSLDQYDLPSKWICVAAGNRLDENDIKEFNAALANRFQIINFVPEIDKWAEWGAKPYGSGREHEKMMKDPKYARGIKKQNLRPEVVAFILTKKEWFHKMDPDQLLAATPWPSPRSWTNASSAIDIAEYKKRKRTGNEDAKLTEKEVIEVVDRWVGKTAAVTFGGFWKIIDEIVPGQIDAIFTDGANAPLPPGKKKGKDSRGNTQYDIDKAHSFGIMAAFERKNNELTDEEFKNFLEYTIKVDNRQLANTMVGTLVRNNPRIKDEMAKSAKMMNKWADKYGIDINQLNDVGFDIETNQEK